MTATQVRDTQRAAAGRFMDMTTWARARAGRAKKLSKALTRCPCGEGEDDLPHWYLQCQRTQDTRQLFLTQQRATFGTGITEMGDAEWMALAMGGACKRTHRRAKQGRIAHPGTTRPRKIVEALMEKAHELLVLMFCKSRILEGQEWGRRKERGDEL
eukprot:gene17265-biopygen7646